MRNNNARDGEKFQLKKEKRKRRKTRIEEETRE